VIASSSCSAMAARSDDLFHGDTMDFLRLTTCPRPATSRAADLWVWCPRCNRTSLNYIEEGASPLCRHVQLIETTPCPFRMTYKSIYVMHSGYREEFLFFFSNPILSIVWVAMGP
jgi:hypothetical protein